MNLFIGSSSIGVFTLFKKSTYKIIKIKGGTAKGLYTNENGKKIINIIGNIKNPINCIILHFGEVDINFSYYYKVCNSENKNINVEDFCNEIYLEYIKFINKIVEISKCKNLIINGLYPNPIKDNLKKEQLLNYGIIIDNSNCILESTLNSKFQEKIRKYYNNLLYKFCIEKNKIYNKKLNNTYFFYYDLDKYIFHNGKINNRFIDISDINIHLRWEPMVFYHIKILNKYCGISKYDLNDIKQIEKKYLKYKINELQNKGFLKKYTKKEYKKTKYLTKKK